MPTELVEIGFDLRGAGGPFLVLDDPIAGQLDDPDWVLGGTIFIDITDDVTNFTIRRGKSNDIANFSSGESVVELNNRLRYYDPTYEASPYYGNIIPKRQVRISTNGIIQYFGSVDDWNLAYQPNGDAVANFVTSDGFADLANTTITAGTSTPQFSGARVNAVLDDPTVGWSPDNRNIDTGSAYLGADVIAADTNALAYIHKVEQSELGRFFIAKDGKATFQDRTVAPSSVGLIELSNTGTGIPYQDLTVMYGSEDLANEIVLTSAITSTTVVANDTDSQNAYGIYNLTLSDLLLNDDTQLTDTALFLASKYSQPQYRFDSLNVRLNSLTTGQQNQILGLELGSVVKVTFLPSNLPPAIVRYAEIIRIGHSVDIAGEHTVNFGLATVDLTYLVLDDPVFGMLDTNSNVLGF
jgi:hypothetical protein